MIGVVTWALTVGALLLLSWALLTTENTSGGIRRSRMIWKVTSSRPLGGIFGKGALIFCTCGAGAFSGATGSGA